MNDSVKIAHGDLYCPHCVGDNLAYEADALLGWQWDCYRCGKFEHPFAADQNGRFTWTWDADHPRPNPGCPWCGTCNIGASSWYDEPHWRCYRLSCGKHWRGTWTRTDNDRKTDRWTIRVPVSEVPWASGTVADMECNRRRRDIDWNCCRFPKSCSAFDPGFRTGKGPTTLPIVWNDGYTWRSGPPDGQMRGLPADLQDEIQAAWLAAKPREKVSDDDGDDCGQGCEYICRCFR